MNNIKRHALIHAIAGASYPEPRSLVTKDLPEVVVDKGSPATAELFDIINTLNIIVHLEETSDKKVKRVNSIIRDYCNAKSRTAKHQATKLILAKIAKPVLCREELRKATQALNFIETNAKEVIDFGEA